MPKFINITKKWGNKSIFDKFSLELPDGKVSVILGESGVGKSTLLSVAASLFPFTKISNSRFPRSISASKRKSE